MLTSSSGHLACWQWHWFSSECLWSSCHWIYNFWKCSAWLKLCYFKWTNFSALLRLREPPCSWFMFTTNDQSKPWAQWSTTPVIIQMLHIFICTWQYFSFLHWFWPESAESCWNPGIPAALQEFQWILSFWVDFDLFIQKQKINTI